MSGFVRQYYSKEEFTHETIKKSNKEYDGFISGSDMIWNLEVNGNDFSYFLDFAEDSKKSFLMVPLLGNHGQKNQ